MGILAEVEGAGFGRRAVPLLPLLSDVLGRAAALDAERAELAGGESEAGGASEAPGWQEAYYTLVLLQKVCMLCALYTCACCARCA